MAWHGCRIGTRTAAVVAGLVGVAGASKADAASKKDAPQARSFMGLKTLGLSRRLLQPCPSILPSNYAAPLCCEQDTGAQRVRFGSCKLRDGRVLAYHDEGEGVPVFVFHGMGSSRLTWLSKEPVNKICPGVRLIAVDRPGYGNSSSPPFGYSYTTFAHDIEELANDLQLPRFCVAGHSSGGPYALAVAAELPTRVAAAAAISSDAPYVHPNAPSALRESDSFAQSAVVSPRGLYGRNPLEFAEEMRSGAFKKGDITKVHAWKPGVLGWVCDYTLERIPWSFAVEKITLGPRLTIWVGGEDIEAIMVGAPFLAQLASGSQLRVVPGGNHGFKNEPEHLASILSELRKQWGA